MIFGESISGLGKVVVLVIDEVLVYEETEQS